MHISNMPPGLLVGLAGFAAAAVTPIPLVHLNIDATCEDVASNSNYEYLVYSYPANTDKCITFGAPGFPFISPDPVTQCGDYTDGGVAWSDCTSYPKNAKAVSGAGADMSCSFWTSEDCGISGDDPVWIVMDIPAAGTGCQDFPPQLPLSGGQKQTASSMACKLK